MRRKCGCGRLAASKGYNSRGKRVWGNKCEWCRYHVYRHYKKDNCELCGFVPIHPSQLDVDHIDANHNNNNPDNLMTLCANCHRLKTHLNKDYMAKESQSELERFDDWALFEANECSS